MALRYLFAPFEGKFHFVIVPEPGGGGGGGMAGQPMGLLLALTYSA